ncbi:hypothetical protein [Flavobacterium proteolyticum]|uniref:Outer membrane protein beta-barrel domain-containing protein n=1 Tax=Flavobacterium proteolyticum TaxID=2911683 RepID=A0ABR9WUP8_9FLAO|nr:hypothetical protein [Flavobacterium proteolyticum]MBE9577362.1 hypothetical protein [Flavobacterium proteolyticum]
MKKIFTLLTLITITFLSAQTKFEKGYYIDQNNKKINCEILKKKWIQSPEFITVKINNEELQVDCKSIIEFEVSNIKFIRTEIKIDDSKINSEKIFYSLKNKLIRVLVEGDISLYMLDDEKDRIFLIKEQNDTIRQLLHKKISSDNKRYYISSYKRQLARIERDTMNKVVKNVKYDYSDLSKYVIKMNKKIGKNETKTHVRKDSVLVQFRLGANYRNENLKKEFKGNIDKTIDFGNNSIISLNSEIEIIPPVFNRNYGLLFDFSFDINKVSGEADYYNPIFINPDYKIKYEIKNTFNSSIGVKRYFKLNKNTSFFIIPKVGLKSVYKGHIYVQRDIDSDFKINNPNFGITLGANYKNLILELNYTNNTNVDVPNSLNIGIKYNILKINNVYDSIN